MTPAELLAELLNQQNAGLQVVRAGGGPRRLHSIHGVLRGRVFAGQIEADGRVYQFSYAPVKAALVEDHLLLTGRLALSLPQRSTRLVDDVRARLIATQGGVGAAPARRRSPTAPAGETGPSEPKLEQDKGPETDLQPGLHAFESPRVDELGRPVVNATGPLGFAGALYFNLSPLDGAALGVALDLSRVQLNARLAPTDDLARELQLLFSDLVAALFGERLDRRAASDLVEKLDQIFKA